MGIMPVINRSPVNADNDNHYEALVAKHHIADKNYDNLKDYNYIPIWSTVPV